MLKRWGLSFEPGHVTVREVHFVFQDEAYIAYSEPAFQVTRRDEFDHWLVQCAQRRGITIRQGEAVIDINPGQDYVEVITEQATIQAQVVVAADGSHSFVCQKLKWNDEARLSRLLEVLTPESIAAPAFQAGIAILDFSRLSAGLQGYYWDFPSLVYGQPTMNRGIFDSRARPERSRVPLKQTLAEAMRERGRNLSDYALKGHPIHWFSSKARFARPRILLAGDAAGVDPLFGEGISFALAYGEVVAEATQKAFTRQEFSFSDYRARVLRHPFLSQLPKRAAVARLIYGLRSPWQQRLLWRLVCMVIRMFIWTRPKGSLSKEAHRVTGYRQNRFQ